MARLKNIEIVGPDGRILERMDVSLLEQVVTVIWTFDTDVSVSGFADMGGFEGWLDGLRLIDPPASNQIAFTGLAGSIDIDFGFESLARFVPDYSPDDNEAPGLAEASYGIAEGTVDVAGISATDPEDDALVFSISGGADAALFEIDADGELRFIAGPDFEAPGDADGDGVYSVEVMVTDAAGASDRKTYDVTVEDVNEAPAMALASYGIAENTTEVARISAIDPEGDTFVFSIAGGPDGALFEIDADGLLSFIVAPDFEAPADAGGDNVYDVIVGVSDGRLSDTASFQVHVGDAADTFHFV